ncbi:MAG TPA: SUMF1/EgtB/PvdO family nonheme iron enzyme [Polyangiaceae bacterium]|nr:SUMF1/EgtB/PvdO family nonheme iron enzyme [Polyangiaceae bacterium]
MKLTSATVLVALALAGCGGEVETLPPTGQILLYVDTDAPLPPPPGAAAETGSPPWLFDRLRFEVRRGSEVLPDVIALAERDFPVHTGLFAGGPVSIGIAPEPYDEDLVVRVQLFRGDRIVAGKPQTSGTIESNVSLPAVQDEGIQNVFISLRVDDTGVPQGTPAPLPAESEPPVTSLAGSWAGAATVACSAEAGPGEVCIPGGAFWMGDKALRGSPEMLDSDQERLVVVSPFYLDETEVTVGAFRELADELEQRGEVLPSEWSGKSDAADRNDFATFTRARHPADPDDTHAALPVNAVIWSTARAYCQLRGKDLPSEVMLEFVASGRGRENLYVWGNDAPECDDKEHPAVVVARAGLGVYAAFDDACRPPASIGGVLPPGSGTRDRIAGDNGRTVEDLAGNLSEWTLDWLTEQDEAPWATQGTLRDPIALEPGRGDAFRSVRGGSWRGRFPELRAAARSGRDPLLENRSVGFRCARSDAP